jgi:hypothetical protein
MSDQVKRILIVFPEETLAHELSWFHENMGKFAVRTCILRKPEIIASNVELLGINAWFYKYKDEKKEYIEEMGEADLVLKSDKTYYLVETKRPTQFKSGWEQVLRARECFISEMEARKMKYDEVIAVLATTDPIAKTFKKEGPFTLEELNEGELSLKKAVEFGVT